MKKLILLIIISITLLACNNKKKEEDVILNLDNNVILKIVSPNKNGIPIETQKKIAEKLSKKLNMKSETKPTEPNFGILFIQNEDGTIHVRVTVVAEWKGHKKGINAGYYTVDKEGNIIKSYLE